MTTIYDVIEQLEKLAPLHYQEDYDNSGLQVGFPLETVEKVLVCVDVTEEIIEEAKAMGCKLIVSHHPLLFKGIRTVSYFTRQQRCVVKAIKAGIAIYSAHTSLDNARGGVNFKIADMIGLNNLDWIIPSTKGPNCGSGLIGDLDESLSDLELLKKLKRIFKVDCLQYTGCTGKLIQKVALCGGAGSFLIEDAHKLGADCYITGEFHYHDFFEGEGMLLAELGHYQSERCTVDILVSHLSKTCPQLCIIPTKISSNPISILK